MLSALDPEQRQVAEALHGPVCVLAGAGTGKTRAITHRIAHGVLTGAYRAGEVLAVTFTTRAAGEMRSRLRALSVEGVQARTFHSAALRQARFFWPRAVGGDLPQVVESKLGMVRAAATSCRIGADDALLRDLAGEIEWAKVSNAPAEDYASIATSAGRQVNGADPATVARVYAAYEEVKATRNCLDMEDVLLAAVGLLSTHPGIAEQVRAQYRHLVVDEYQDVSPVQQRLLDLWRGDSEEICVVGDPAQTIYSFAGARPHYLLSFAERHPGAQVIRLTRDYRSTPQVVSVANALLAGAAAADRTAGGARHDGLPGTGGTDERAGTGIRGRVTGAGPLVSQRPDGPPPSFHGYSDEVAEAAGVAKEIGALVASGVRPQDVAILFRINAMSQAYEQALADAGIAYVVRGTARFFERPEIRQAVMMLRGAARAGGTATDGLAATVRGVLSGVGWSSDPPAARGAVRERWESLAALMALAEEFGGAGSGTGVAGDLADRGGNAAPGPDVDGGANAAGRGMLEAFVAELDARAALQHAPAGAGVTLTTLHGAKGLEWEAVFLVGCHEGALPISYAQTPAQVEEERRLCYVGVTRARTRLSVSWSLARSPGGRSQRAPSRFLDGVRPDAPIGAREGRPGRRDRRGGPVRCRVCGAPVHTAAERKLGRCAGCPSSADEALIEALKAWRLDQARAANVPAYVVFTDATLTAIAETSPADARELATVPGVGTVKLDRYGRDVLEICTEFRARAS